MILLYLQGVSGLSAKDGKIDLSAHVQTLLDRAVGFIDTPRKFWPVVPKLYRWILRLGGGPYRHIVHYNLARAVHEDEDYEEAAKHYRRAIELNPDFYKAHNNLGNVLCLMGRYEESEASYRRALEIRDYFSPHNNLAHTYLRTGRLDAAEAEVQLALELKPNSVIAHITYAQILTAMEHGDQAEEWYRRALAIDSEHTELLTSYAEFLLHRGRLEDAAEISSKARRLATGQKQDNDGLREWRQRSIEYVERKGDRMNVS